MQTRAWKFVAVSVVLGGIAACSDSTSSSSGGLTADLRIAQTVRSAASVRVRVGTTWSAQILPGILSTVMKVPIGPQSVVFEPTGGTVTGSTQQLTFEAGRQYLIVTQDSQGVVVPSLLADTGAAPVPGKSKLRVVHSAALAPPIDIWRSQPDYDTLIRVMFPFGYREESPYLQSDPGNWTVAVSHANVVDTLYRTAPIMVGAGKLVTVIVLDSSAAGGFTTMVIADN
jgi:Domain of unknown function (DUF4397)